LFLRQLPPPLVLVRAWMDVWCQQATGPCHNREVFTNNTCVSHRFQPSEYDMFNASDLAVRGQYTASRHILQCIAYSMGVADGRDSALRPR